MCDYFTIEHFAARSISDGYITGGEKKRMVAKFKYFTYVIGMVFYIEAVPCISAVRADNYVISRIYSDDDSAPSDDIAKSWVDGQKCLTDDEIYQRDKNGYRITSAAGSHLIVNGEHYILIGECWVRNDQETGLR